MAKGDFDGAIILWETVIHPSIVIFSLLFLIMLSLPLVLSH